MCPTLWTLMDSSMPGSSVLHYLPEFTQIHVHWDSDAIQPSHSLLPLLILSSVFPCIRVFSSQAALHIRWPKYWGFRITFYNEYSELIPLGLTGLIFPAVQGTLKSLLQHYNSKPSILQPLPSLCSSAHICTWLLEKPQLWLCKLTYSQIWMNHVNQKFQS